MRFLSVCSGIEAASCALEPLGFTPVGFAEIDKAASRVLAHHYSHVPNYGDFTLIEPQSLGKVDWLIGGTPCQAFSIAGKRLSLQDARGNLTLAYAVLAHELVRHNGLRGCLWENVPGVLNAPDNAFGCFLAALVGSEQPLVQPKGRGWPDAGMVDGPWARATWRVLDAQYFGLAQRRQRVFVVASFGDGIDPAAILFEPKSLYGNLAPSRETREGVARPLAASPGGGSGYRNDADTADNLIATSEVAGSLNSSVARGTGQANETGFLIAFGGNNCSGPIEVAAALLSHGGPAGRMDFGSETFIAGPIKASSGKRGGVPEADDTASLVPCAFDARQSDVCVYGDHTAPLDTDGFSQAIAFQQSSRDELWLPGGDGGIAGAITADRGSKHTNAIAIDLRNGTVDDVAMSVQSGGMGDDRGLCPNAIPHTLTEEPYTLAIRGRGDDTNLEYRQDGTANALLLPNGGRAGIGVGAIATRWAVRRLTPRECERLQGFPDNYTLIPDENGKGQADGARYRQLGNSFAVPVVRWIGEQILADAARHESAAA